MFERNFYSETQAPKDPHEIPEVNRQANEHESEQKNREPHVHSIQVDTAVGLFARWPDRGKVRQKQKGDHRNAEA
jgi:hypothetical protein